MRVSLNFKQNDVVNKHCATDKNNCIGVLFKRDLTLSFCNMFVILKHLNKVYSRTSNIMNNAHANGPMSMNASFVCGV